jgi:16S rRNA processing protein RimM
MQEQNKLILAGIIVAAHGIKGHGIIKSFTDPKANICSLKVADEQGKQFTLKLIKENSKGDLICKINEVRTRNDIEKIIKTKLYCLKNDLPQLDQDEFYVENLKNLKVYCRTTKSCHPQACSGSNTQVQREILNKLPDDGCNSSFTRSIFDEDMNEIGIINDAYNFGAGDIIEIKLKGGKLELFPFTHEFFPIVTKEYAVLEKKSISDL